MTTERISVPSGPMGAGRVKTVTQTPQIPTLGVGSHGAILWPQELASTQSPYLIIPGGI